MEQIRKQNQPIRILDINFRLLCEIEDYESLLFIRNFDTYGSFELKINRYKQNVEHLKRGNIVYLNGKKAGFIEYRQYNIDSNGKAAEELIIKGYTLEYLLTFRMTDVPANTEQWSLEGPAETVLKSMVSYNLGVNAKENRKIPVIQILETKGKGGNISFSSRYKKLEEECTRISNLSGLGIQIRLDYKLKRFIFDSYEGKNLTAKQTVNPPVIFSTEFDNIATQTLIDSSIDHKNTAIVAGQGEGVDREIQLINDTKKGLARRELFVDARDIGVDSLTTLEERGQEKLEELKEIYSLEGTILPFNSFVFEKDYDLGDIVTVKFFDIDTVVYVDTRITQVSESWDTGGYEVSASFGEKVPNMIDKIKRLVEEKNVVN